MLVIFLSVPNLLRTLLIIAGILVILRFIGKIMNGKRNFTAQKKQTQAKREFEQAKEKSEKNKGKVSLKKGNIPAEDVDFEEVE